MPSPAPDPLTSRPLSVWLVNPFDDIPGEGISPLRYWSLARILAGRGHSVTWWTATWSHRRKAVRSAPFGLADDEGFAVRLVAVRPYERNVSLARLASHRDFGRNFERLATEAISSGQLGRPDIILASLPPLESPEAACRLAQRLDTTFILDVQDLWPETFERLLPGPGSLRRALARLVFGKMLARRVRLIANADALSATTASYAQAVFEGAGPDVPRHACYVGTYAAEFPPPPRFSRDPLAIDSKTQEPQGGPQKTEQAVNARPLECVYAGSLEAGQDIEVLPAAVRQLSARGVSATIHVAGTGKLEPKLRRAAEQAVGSCRLEVHGLLGRHEYVRLLSRCDVGLVCVKPETMVAMPNKACDYAAAGLALVNSLAADLGNLIHKYDAGVAYAAGDAGSLARAIEALAYDRGSLLAMRQAARRMAEVEFDREKTYPIFADWIETVAGGV